MRGFTTLLKKELKEQLRTYRVYVVGGIFLFFGFSTPLTLKYLPDILNLAGEDIVIEFPPPTAQQALDEYSSTIAQIGVLVAVLLAMSAIAQERSKGTALITLSQPISRYSFITAKLSALSTSFVVALVAGSTACYLYTVTLIEEISPIGFIGQNLLLVLFLIFCISVTLFFSGLFRNQLAAGGVSLAVLVGQAALTQLPWVGDLVPGALTNWGSQLLSGNAESTWGAVAISLGIIALCLFFAKRNLEHREI